MTDRRIRTALSEELDPAFWAEIQELCSAAFEESAEELWDHLGPGLHVTAEVGGRVVGHAMIVDRTLYLGPDGGATLDAGYVENVATAPTARSEGHGSAVMEAVGQILHDEYAIGALATGSGGFYAPLGWEVWTGPTSVRMPDGELARTSHEDGHVMVLRTPRTPRDLDLGLPISVDWRAAESW